METVVLRLKGESRLYLGSYDTQFHEEDPFRAQSLKGLWRYWLRAYIAGAMYDAGILKCERKGEYVCKSDLEGIAEKTGYLLGSLKSASKFRIVVSKASARRREDGFGGRFLKNKRIDYSMIRELIGETLRSARSYLDLKKGNPSEIPPVDCISEAKIDLSGINGSTNLFNKKEVPVFTVIRAKPRSRKDIETMVIELQDFFYRPERSRKMGFRISSADKSQDPITRGRLAWFLGLPKTQRGTGYLDAERRASPVHLAVHENEALFTLFLSGDWPTEIRWKGIGRPIPLRIDLLKVKEAYLTSISSLEGYLDRIGYETEVIFP